MIEAFKKTNEAFFMMLARSFLGRMENDLLYRGGTAASVIAVMDKNLYATKKITELMNENAPLRHSYDRYPADCRADPIRWNVNYRLGAKGGRRAELLKDPDYMAVLNKYR